MGEADPVHEFLAGRAKGAIPDAWEDAVDGDEGEERALVVRAAELCAGAVTGWQDDFDPERGAAALRWRRRYLDWRVQLMLRWMATALLLVGQFDTLYVCSPLPAFATTCTERPDNPSVQATEAALLWLIVLALALQAWYKGARVFVRSKWMVFVSVVAVTSATTLLTERGLSAVRQTSFTDLDVKNLWLVRAACRPVFFLHFDARVRRVFFQMFRLVPRAFPIFFLIMFVNGLFALFGRMLVLDPQVAGSDFGLPGNGFDTLGGAFVTCFWWSFTTNGPEPGAQVGRPGTKGGAIWALFWTVYTIVQVFYLTQLITAVVFDLYSEINDADAAEGVAPLKRDAMAAFDLLKRGSRVSGRRMDALLAELAPLRLGGVAASAASFREGKGVPLTGFVEVLLGAAKPEPDVLALESYEQFLAQASGLARLRHGSFVAWRSRGTDWFFHLLAILNTALVFCGGEDLVQKHVRAAPAANGTAVAAASAAHTALGYTGEPLEVAITVVSALFLADLAAALVVFGPGLRRLPVDHAWLRWCVTAIAIAAAVVIKIASSHEVAATTMLHLAVYLVAQLLVIVALIPSLRIVMTTMVVVGPRVRDLIVANLCIMYVWCVVGMYLIGGKVLTSNQALQNYPFGTMFSMNFNSLGNGLYTLFMVVYGNNMQQFTQPFFIVGGWPIVVHTASFYLFTSLISANVLVAALIDVHGEVRERLEAIDKARRAALAARKGQVVPEPSDTFKR
jgi:hypothetical protein